MNWKAILETSKVRVANLLRVLANKLHLEEIKPICIDQLPDGYLQQLLCNNYQICVVYTGYSIPGTADIKSCIQYSYKSPLPADKALPVIGEIIRSHLVSAVVPLSTPPGPSST
jgi:hypothetical protein